MLTYQSFATPYVHLGIKRIVVKEVGAMEFLVMGLVHCYHVLLPFENLNLEDFNLTIEDISNFNLPHLIRHLGATPDEASLPGDGHQGPELPVYHHRLVAVRVLEYYVGDPEQVNLNII